MKAGRHDPLEIQIAHSEAASVGVLREAQQDGAKVDESTEEVMLGSKRKKKAKSKVRLAGETTDTDGMDFIEPDLSRKILREARAQQDEELENQSSTRETKVEQIVSAGDEFPAVAASAGDAGSVVEDAAADHGEGGDETYSYLDQSQITEEDERILAMFCPAVTADPAAKAEGGTLADIIMRKIQEQENLSDAEPLPPSVSSMDPKIIRVYQGVGKVLASHRSGQLPKAFKVRPGMCSRCMVILFVLVEKCHIHARELNDNVSAIR